MTDDRGLIGRVFVEPLDRAVLAGVPAAVDSADAATSTPSASAPNGGSEEPAPSRPPRRALDVGIVPLFSDERPLTGLAGFFDWRASGMLSRLVRTQWWSGGVGEAVLLPARRDLPVERIVLFGLGGSDRFDESQARKAAADMVALAEGLCPRDVMFAMPGKGQERAIVEAVFDAALTAMRGRSEDLGPPSPDDPDGCAWWVIADPRHVARLRRVLEGPPRAAGASE